MSVSDRIRINNVRVLSDEHYTLKTTSFKWRRDNGNWQTQQRETYDIGNAAAVLPYSLARRSVVLVRQFRYPAYVTGHDDLLIEVTAGKLDDQSPEARIRAEAEEEIGYRLGEIKNGIQAFLSPRSLTRNLYVFVPGYPPV